MVCFSSSSLRPSSQPHNLLLFYIFAPMSHSATPSSLSWWVSFLFVQPHSAILKRGPVKAKQHKLPIVFSIIHGLNHLQRYQDWTLSAPSEAGELFFDVSFAGPAPGLAQGLLVPTALIGDKCPFPIWWSQAEVWWQVYISLLIFQAFSPFWLFTCGSPVCGNHSACHQLYKCAF